MSELSDMQRVIYHISRENIPYEGYLEWKILEFLATATKADTHRILKTVDKKISETRGWYHYIKDLSEFGCQITDLEYVVTRIEGKAKDKRLADIYERIVANRRPEPYTIWKAFIETSEWNYEQGKGVSRQIY